MRQRTPIACIVITHWRARLELARRPDLANCAGLIVNRAGHRAMVVDHLPTAAGRLLGMTLERALSLEPDAVVFEADEAHYRQQFEEMLCALEQVSDRVEGAELGIAYVGVDGTAEMNDELLHAVPARFRPRIGIGANKFTAFVAARMSRSSSVARVPGDLAAFLAPCSVDLLPCPSEFIDDLHLLGLHQMGEVATQDPNALLDRFGREGRRAWELCNGIDDRPLVPRVHEESITEAIMLPSEAVSMGLLRVTVDTLLQRVFAQPRMRGRYAGLATLVCQLEDGPTWERTYHFKSGVGHWKRATEIIKGRLEAEHPEAPVEAMTITLANLSGATGEQLSFFPGLRADREQRLLEVERQLRARLDGKHSLHRLVEIAPWHPVPEMRVMQVPLEPVTNDRMRPLTAPEAVTVREGPNQEPLAVRIGEHWREVARIEDRWSFDLWWRPTPIQRDYYRINQADGRQLTVFRDQREGCWYRQGASV